MKFDKVIIALLMVVSFILIWNASEPLFEKAEVFIVDVVDGDTVKTLEKEKIRLQGINTPEKGEFSSLEAEEFLSGLVLNKTIEFESFGKDRYGRSLGYLFLDKKNINELILQEGLGHLYVYDSDKYTEDLEEAESLARENEKGIWKKSENYGCLEVLEFVYLDLTEEDSERLVLENVCAIDLTVTIKDDATHIYEEEALVDSLLVLETQNIWNDNGDSVYIWDSDGLVLFTRYL